MKQLASTRRISGLAATETLADAPQLYWLWTVMDPWCTFSDFVNDTLRASTVAVEAGSSAIDAHRIAVLQVSSILAAEKALTLHHLKVRETQRRELLCGIWES